MDTLLLPFEAARLDFSIPVGRWGSVAGRGLENPEDLDDSVLPPPGFPFGIEDCVLELRGVVADRGVDDERGASFRPGLDAFILSFSSLSLIASLRS